MSEGKIMFLQNIFGCMFFAGIIFACMARNEATCVISFVVALIGYVGARKCEVIIEKEEKEDEMLENRMVVDSEWERTDPVDFSESKISMKLNGTGYKELRTDVFVPEEDAFDYAMERVSLDKEEKKEFVEWFYSGNWVKEE